MTASNGPAGPRATRTALAVALAVLIVVGGVLATRPGKATYIGAAIPENRVVAVLQYRGSAASEPLREAMLALRAKPDDLVAATAAARLVIADGRKAGDSRLVGAALGFLRPFMADANAETLYLAATARQYQHDFPAALGLLDQAIAKDPRYLDALLTRATVLTVLGRYDRALPDCQAIHALPQPQVGFLCQATALIQSAEAPALYQRLKTITGARGALDPALKGWAVGLMGEIAMLQGNADLAIRHLAAVVADDPLALRERLLLVDVLLGERRSDQALTLLEDTPEIDGVLIRRVLARDLQGESATVDRTELARRFQLNLDLGLTAHAREETRFFLQIAKDYPLALQRAEVNWALQHEIEDAQLLIDAAVAAGRPQAAAPVLAWMAEQKVVVPGLRIPASVVEAAK